MMSLIIGAGASGKSEFAEKYALERFDKHKNTISSVRGGRIDYGFDGELIYLATMINSDAETDERIDKHVRRRSGMGFKTLEVSTDLGKLGEQEIKPNSVVLLECLSTLLANEMFSKGEPAAGYEGISDKIFEDIRKLKNGCRDLIIVSNNVFEDGQEYTGETALYLKYLGELHRRLGKSCDEICEVVVGIPIRHEKPDKPGTAHRRIKGNTEKMNRWV